MKPFRMMHLLHHIHSQTPCPQCKKGLDFTSFRIDHVADDNAFLSINCPHCQSESQAHVVIQIGDAERVSSTEQHQDSDIEETEFLQAADLLKKHTGGVSELFSSSTTS